MRFIQGVSGFYSGADAWIGGTDQAQEGQFVWDDGKIWS